MLGIGVHGECTQQAAAGMEIVELDGQDNGEAFGQILAADQRGLEARGHLPLRLIVKCEHDGVLGIEIVVGSARGNPRADSYFPHGGCFKAPLAEQFQCYGENPRARFVSLCWRGHRALVSPRTPRRSAGALGLAFRRIRFRTYRLNIWIPPSTTSAKPTFWLISSIASRAETSGAEDPRASVI